jgi:predicted RND superfamily exporter protein
MTTTLPPTNENNPPDTEHEPDPPSTPPRLETLFTTLERRVGLVAAVVAVITSALVVPFLTMAPDVSASTEPSGEVFTARDRIADTFVSSVYPTFLIVEHESGQVLSVDALSTLLAAQDTLRADPDFGPELVRTFDPETGQEINGMLTLADLVDAELRAQGIDGIEAATDEQVASIGSALIDRLGERSTILGISAQSVNNDGTWTVPALNFPVLSDDTQLGFGNTAISLGGDTDSEQYSRDIQEFFRVDGWQANGVAIDVNLTSQEQGAVAGPFIGFTILAVLLLVGLTFRSYWILATVSVAFLALIIWLKGISNLIGLEDDLVLSLIVPVAMISFGVDFAFHALGRYREERAEGRPSRTAYIAGMTAVSGALVLALVSDTTAFLANLTSGIESINQFGIGAAIALISAYLLLGVVTPLVVARIEGQVPAPALTRASAAWRVFAGIGVASATMASVLMLVFVLPWLGVILTAVTAVVFLLAPFLIRRRDGRGQRVGQTALADTDGRLARPIGAMVTALARRPAIVLPLALVTTAVTAVFALQVPAEFDVEDFFSSDTDFVVSLDQIDTHVGDRGGEPAELYVEGDLADPAALATLAAAVDKIRALDTESLAREGDGSVLVETGVLAVLDATWESPVMAGIVADQTGVALTDTDGDRIPDTREQVEALFTVAADIGVPLDAERPLLTPDDVNTMAVINGTESATVLELGLVDSRRQESVTNARDDLTPIAEQLSDDLGGSFVQTTGSPFVREASLEATNRALQTSLPIALLACLAVSSIFLRSIRYGIVSILPIVMVVSWLYAFMYAAGYAINLVTATIAAVSIGIGIDFAIHFIARYREELERTGQRREAVRITGEGTGLALVASAVSSAVGFGIMALAPMPLFAAYGLLTALMIMMALVATLAVLPSMLMVLTADRPPASASTGD